MNEQIVKAGDVLFCIKGVEDLVYHALYQVESVSTIDGDIVVGVKDKDGHTHYASLQLFLGLAPAEAWTTTLEKYMSNPNYDEMMEYVHTLMSKVEKLVSKDESPEEADDWESVDDYTDYDDDDDDDWEDDDWHDDDWKLCDWDDDDFDEEDNEWFECDLDDLPKPTVTRESILADAKKCVCGDREQDYGSPEDNFGTIAKFWSTYTKSNISAVDVAAMLSLLKIARIASGHGKYDNWVDLAGYAACGAEIQSKM